MALTDDLISYWKMDEASGNALDAHGPNDLTDTGGVGSTTGKINNARNFDGGRYFSHADNASLSTGDIDFSFSCWVNDLDIAGGNRRIICKSNAALTAIEYDLMYYATGGHFRWDVYGSGGADVGTAEWGSIPSTSTWYHIVAWHDSVNNQVGLTVNDGTPVVTSTSGSVIDSSAPFSIGSLDGLSGTDWPGYIDEVGFWKRVLTAGEITQLYNSGAGLAYPFPGGGGGLAAGAESAYFPGGMQPQTSPLTISKW